MNMQHHFKAERKVAFHCAELLSRTSAAQPPLAKLEAIAALIADQMSEGLRAISGSAPKVSCSEAQAITALELASITGADFNHAMIETGVDRLAIIASFDCAAAFILIDQAFGGRGQIPDLIPAPLPVSITMMMSQIHQAIASAISSALGAPAQVSLENIKQDKSPCFAPKAPLASILLTMASDQGPEWHIRLTVQQSRLGDLSSTASGSYAAKLDGERSDAAEPYSAIPLTMRAILATSQISISRIAQLCPGQMLPVAFARHIPLCIDDVEIARGTIGAVDDAVAIKITQISN